MEIHSNRSIDPVSKKQEPRLEPSKDDALQALANLVSEWWNRERTGHEKSS